MKIAIYARVSTERQAEQGVSIEDQVNQIEQWAKEKRHIVVARYIDSGTSAFSGKRPHFEQMVDEALSNPNPFDAIVVYSQSRFYRDNMRRALVEKRLEDNHVRVICLTQPLPEDENTANLLKNFTGIIDEYQSRENAKHVSRCLIANAKAGYFNGARTPYGYITIKTDKPARTGVKKKLAINKEEARLVQLIFHLALKGTNGTPFGVKRIAELLNENGYTYRGRPWRLQKVHQILRNPIYYGRRETFKVDTRHKRMRPPSEWVIVPVPPIVAKDVFLEVGQSLETRGLKRPEARAETSPSLLTGIIKCAPCKKNLQVMTGKSGQYKYYRCPTKKDSGVRLCNCPNIPKEKIEKLVLERLINEVIT